MVFPGNTNPQFVAWYNAQEADVRDAIDTAWAATMTSAGVLAGHKSAEYARLSFLISHCRDVYGYAG